MDDSILGIHHITAMAGLAQQNLGFYVRVLGLRLVKKTVNFDAPDVYHFYYADEAGHPGTILTFFPFGDGPQGKGGAGQASTVSFSICEESVDYWLQRLASFGVAVDDTRLADSPTGPEDDRILSFSDPDGVHLQLVPHVGADVRPGWGDGFVPAAHSIRGFHSVAIVMRDAQMTSLLLTEVMGFRRVSENGSRVRYVAPSALASGGAGAIIDVISDPNAPYGLNSIGTIHHIAWRVPDESALLAWQSRLREVGVHVTEVRDRSYFKSIYFREPGGVLFEFATDPPGFTLDESPAELGTSLKLPEWLEESRVQLEGQLVPVSVPTA